MRILAHWQIGTSAVTCTQARRETRQRRYWRAGLVACCMALLTSCSADTSTPAPRTTYAKSLGTVATSWTPGSNWVMTWNSDFIKSNSLHGWTAMAGGSGWGNKELQEYSPRNVTFAPGVGLVITANTNGDGQQCWYGKCTYSSGRLQTNGLFQQEYGIFSALIKLPAGHGLWPAFWMVRSDVNQDPQTNGGEIDVIEVNNTKPDLVEGFVHSPEITKGFHRSLKIPLSAGYHVYSVEWGPTEITWLVDGHAFGHIANSQGSPFHRPFYLILDLAVGGTWPGSPTAETKFPAQMDVAWVRAYERK